MGEGPPGMLASDAERDHASGVLREACAEGRLTLEEFSDRIERALVARTRAELEEVTADLPAAPLARATQRPAARWSVAIMSGADRQGVWRVGEEHWAIAVMGGCKIDLRQAVISSPVTTINAIAFWGGIEVYVPEGVEVELEGIAIMAGKEYKHVGPPPPPGAPVVRINAYACMAGVTVSDQPSFSDRVKDAVLDGLDRRQLREERRRRRRELRGR